MWHPPVPVPMASHCHHLILHHLTLEDGKRLSTLPLKCLSLWWRKNINITSIMSIVMSAMRNLIRVCISQAGHNFLGFTWQLIYQMIHIRAFSSLPLWRVYSNHTHTHTHTSMCTHVHTHSHRHTHTHTAAAHTTCHHCQVSHHRLHC